MIIKFNLILFKQLQKMLKQDIIQLDVRQIQSIKREAKKKKNQDILNDEENGFISQQQSQNQQEENHIEVRTEIFPTQFTPFFVDQFTKQSSLKLYKFNPKKCDIKRFNSKLQLISETFNGFKNNKQKQKLQQILCLTNLEQLIQKINKNQQSTNQNQQLYVPYFQEGKQLEDIQLWQFKHRQEEPIIPYEQREELINDTKLLFKFLNCLFKNKQIQSCSLTKNDVLIQQYRRQNEYSKEYLLKVKVKWMYDLILNSNNNNNNEVEKMNDLEVLQNTKKIVRKLLCINEDKQQRTQLEQMHFQQTQYFLSLDDIVKIKYQDYYPNVKKNQSAIKTQATFANNLAQQAEQLSKLRASIMRLQQLTREEIKNLKVKNQQPKIQTATKQKNEYFWAQIQNFILSAITENERKNIFSVHSKKNQSQKTADRRLYSTPAKSNLKTQNNNELTKIKESTSNFKQITVEMTYIASGSDLKFRPQKLLPLIEEKQRILYIMKVRSKNSQTSTHIACCINAKLQKDSISFIGSYLGDPSKKSFLYSEKSDRFYLLSDRNYAVGYGPDIFLSIGKIDIIIPCFGTSIVDKKQMLECISYYPVSYSSKAIDISEIEQLSEMESDSTEDKFILNKSRTENELGIGKQFYLEDIDIYEVKLVPK